MSKCVIVAIPTEDDYIYKISSEKIPHITLLFLGETNQVKNIDEIQNFVKHAASTSLMRFGLEVDRRGKLGPEAADVLFFSKSEWSGIESVIEYKSHLLKDPNIRFAYNSVEQFPEWIPHLTLGFPATPAKPDTRDYPGTSYVNFDRIAVWFEDYEGIEFPLKRYNGDMIMTDLSIEATKSVLSHYGKKGMKWGVRKASPSGPQGVRLTEKGKKLKTSGGQGYPTHEQAVSARTTGQILKKSGVKALSNQELQAYTQRLNLEAQAKHLNYQQKNAGARFVATVLGQAGKGAVQGAANQAASEQVKRRLAKTAARVGFAAA